VVLKFAVACTLVDRPLLHVDAVRLHVIPWVPIHASRTYTIPSEYRVWSERRGPRRGNVDEEKRCFVLARPARESYLAGRGANRFHRGRIEWASRSISTT